MAVYFVALRRSELLSSPSGASANSLVSGESALHTAARLSCPGIVSTLLEHGADHTLRDPQGKLPLELAPPHSPVAQLLKQVGGILIGVTFCLF